MSAVMSDEQMSALATKAGGVVSHYRTFVKQIQRSNDLSRVNGAISAIEGVLGDFAGADLQQHGLRSLRDSLNGFKGTLIQRRRELTGQAKRTY